MFLFCFFLIRSAANKLKNKRRKEVCASLNDFFSKSLTSITASEAVGERAKENTIPETVLDKGVTTTPCVAYAAPTTSSSRYDKAKELPEYEDVPI